MKKQKGEVTAILAAAILLFGIVGVVGGSDVYYKANASEQCLEENIDRFSTSDDYRHNCYVQKEVNELEAELEAKKAEYK